MAGDTRVHACDVLGWCNEHGLGDGAKVHSKG